MYEIPAYVFSDKHREEMQKLVDYIFEHEISLYLGVIEDMKETETLLSPASFSKIIKQVLGAEYDFLCYRITCNEFCVEIINIAKRYSVGHMYGYPSVAFSRADSHLSPFTFVYAVTDDAVFLRNKKIASIHSQEQIYCSTWWEGPLYVIDRDTGTLNKYLFDGTSVWTQKIEGEYPPSAYTFAKGFPIRPYDCHVIACGTDYLMFNDGDGHFEGVYKGEMVYERIK